MKNKHLEGYNHCTESNFYYHQNLYLKDVSGGVNEIDAIGQKYEWQQIRTSGQKYISVRAIADGEKLSILVSGQ